MPGEDPIHPLRHRVRVFVDFWNYTLSMRDVDKAFRTDWSKLGPVLSQAAAAVVDVPATGEYQGLNFYGSHDPEPVYDILEYLASGMTEEQILADFPDVEIEDVRAILTFAVERDYGLVSIAPG